MDDGYSPEGIVVLIVFILLEAVFYGFGAAIQNINEGKVQEEAENGSKQAVKLLEMAGSPGALIHTLQITTHLIAMIAGALTLPALVRIVGRRILKGQLQADAALTMAAPMWWARIGITAVFVILLILLIVSFGIVIPKRLALAAPEAWAFRLLPAAAFFTVLLWPLSRAVTLISSAVLKLFGIDLADTGENVTEEDIMSMVNEGHEQGVLEADETEMISNIFELGDKEARDIMTHRTGMTALAGDQNLRSAVEFILSEGVNTRYPVYGDDIDDIIGILHLRDAVTYLEQAKYGDWKIRDIPGLLRKAHFIPETRNINTLFKEMQSKKIHMEIVVDEYGQTAGLLTMEDILEEIVGNIMDEYDEEEEFITSREDGSYVMSGLTPLDDIVDLLDVEFSEEDQDTYDTLNGYLVSRLDRIPQEGEMPCVREYGYEFQVLKAGNKKIESVLVKKLPEEAKEQEELQERQEVEHETVSS